jgi:hypothetical protein
VNGRKHYGPGEVDHDLPASRNRHALRLQCRGRDGDQMLAKTWALRNHALDWPERSPGKNAFQINKSTSRCKGYPRPLDQALHPTAHR